MKIEYIILRETHCGKAFCFRQNIYKQYKWLKTTNKHCFCTKMRIYNTGGLAEVRGGDSSHQQFTFNNRWIKLFIYSPLLPFLFPLSACSIFYLSLEKSGNSGGKAVQEQLHLRWCEENPRGNIIFLNPVSTHSTPAGADRPLYV